MYSYSVDCNHNLCALMFMYFLGSVARHHLLTLQCTSLCNLLSIDLSCTCCVTLYILFLQEKVYLFVVGILHSAGLPGNRVPYEVENNIMATQLLVPTICVSKRRRGPVDYIEQAVSSLGYDWKSVSAAKLY